MTLEGYFVIGIIILMIVALAKDLLRPGLILSSAVILMVIVGSITPSEALSGFSNKGMMTVAILFIVSEGIRQTGGIDYIARLILPSRKIPIKNVITRIFFPVSILSAFLNNTPIVIIFAPIVKKWSEKFNLPKSKLLIPLSYAAILGGTTTLIGTSTNLVVHGLMLEEGLPGLTMFELGKVGFFIAIVGFIYLYAFANTLLPGERVKKKGDFVNFREFYFDVSIPNNSSLVGEEIVRRKHRYLNNFLVSSIQRDNRSIKTNKSNYTIQAGDHLTLAGKSDDITDLLQLSAIEVDCMEKAPKGFKKKELRQIEVVLSPRFPGLDTTIREFDFHKHYGAIVMAVHRNGQRLATNVENIELKEGDNLILIGKEEFIEIWGDSRAFLTTTYVGDLAKPEKKQYMWLSLGILVAMVSGAVLNEKIEIFRETRMDMFFFASIAALIMLWTKIVPPKKYTKFISWDILITIAAAFGLSAALLRSGAADVIAGFVINLLAKNYGVLGVLAGVYLLTNLFTEVVTNNAAAALIFPIAFSAAEQLGVDHKPFMIAICIGASASFSTPIGYQTNLIVQGLGNYRFLDYVKIGLPLNVIAFILSMLLIPIFWPF
ncbi:MAG: SLC13 family permease [Bacteroidales bacterium]|jgi:di/tricarboxylate transporter|nr:SLC13 family permease [Bacteroidales bacterium]